MPAHSTWSPRRAPPDLRNPGAETRFPQSRQKPQQSCMIKPHQGSRRKYLKTSNLPPASARGVRRHVAALNWETCLPVPKRSHACALHMALAVPHRFSPIKAKTALIVRNQGTRHNFLMPRQGASLCARRLGEAKPLPWQVPAWIILNYPLAGGNVGLLVIAAAGFQHSRAPAEGIRDGVGWQRFSRPGGAEHILAGLPAVETAGYCRVRLRRRGGGPPERRDSERQAI